MNIENSQQYDGDQTPTNHNDNSDDNHSIHNENVLSTSLFIPNGSINNPSPNTISSNSESSSLFTEILNMNNDNEPQINNFINPITESNNDFRNEVLPSVDDIMNHLTNMLNYDPLNIEQSRESTKLQYFI